MGLWDYKSGAFGVLDPADGVLDPADQWWTFVYLFRRRGKAENTKKSAGNSALSSTAKSKICKMGREDGWMSEVMFQGIKKNVVEAHFTGNSSVCQIACSDLQQQKVKLRVTELCHSLSTDSF